MTSPGAIGAGVLAGVLALCELFNSSRKPPAPRAAGWILVLFGFDAGFALLVYAILIAAFDGLTWFTGVWPTIIAGLSGPALLRSQLALLGSGQESTYYGPAVRYRRVQRGIERRIDQLSADAQSSWVADKLQYVQHLDPGYFTIRVTNFVKSLSVGFSDDEKHEILDYIVETLSDTDQDGESRCRAVVQKLLDSGCRECVKGLAREGKKKARHADGAHVHEPSEVSPEDVSPGR